MDTSAERDVGLPSDPNTHAGRLERWLVEAKAEVAECNEEIERLRAGATRGDLVTTYVYVASSWRNPTQPVVIEALRRAGVDAYDFRNPEAGTGFSWKEVKAGSTPGIAGKGSDWETVDDYLAMVNHPRALEGFASDFAAMELADAFVLVLPCGKSAHLELGWAVGAGKRTAILLEDPVEPELMYRMVDHLSTDVEDLLSWLGATP